MIRGETVVAIAAKPFYFASAITQSNFSTTIVRKVLTRLSNERRKVCPLQRFRRRQTCGDFAFGYL